jgi:hypothetical protein
MPKKLSLLEHVHLKQSIAEIITNPNENLKKLKREKYTSNEDWGYFFAQKTKSIGTCAFVGSRWSGNFSNFEKFPMDSQLPRLHLHFALSQPIYERATLPLYSVSMYVDTLSTLGPHSSPNTPNTMYC